MITLIIGTPDSGKSALAEKLAVEQAKANDISRPKNQSRLIYLATMIAYDEAGRKRIEKHRKQREGKGFITIEKAMEIFDEPELFQEKDTVLLECITNLVGNEMYENTEKYLGTSEKNIRKIDGEAVSDKIAKDIEKLSLVVRNLVIVSNRFSDQEMASYDDETRKYMETVNRVNGRLTLLADETINLHREG